MLVHSVLFWLKPDLSPAERARFRLEVGKLAAVPTVAKIYIGPPAPLPARAVTDQTFDIALTIVFRDVAGHDTYQDHPLHVAFVEGCKALWERVLIHDSQES